VDAAIPRRDFLKGAGAAGAAVATALASSVTAPAAAQTAPPPSANPATRPADLVLKNGKVITVDAAFTLVQAIAIAGDRIVAVGPDAAMAEASWVVGHINTLSPRDIEKIVRMGLVITPHTNSNIYNSGHLHQQRLPPERHREITPLCDLLDAGVTVGLVTDNVPISLFWPIWGIGRPPCTRYERARGAGSGDHPRRGPALRDD
jgi:amidohydrolase family protein/TAT (twin-arginine translocation) pathway-exported protein